MAKITRRLVTAPRKPRANYSRAGKSRRSRGLGFGWILAGAFGLLILADHKVSANTSASGLANTSASGLTQVPPTLAPPTGLISATPIIANPIVAQTSQTAVQQAAQQALQQTGQVQTGVTYSGSSNPYQTGTPGTPVNVPFTQPIYYDPITGLPSLV